MTKYHFDLGKAIKTLKAQKGVTNEDIAKEMKVSEVTVSQWINDKQVPSILRVQILCYTYGLIFSDFIIWGETHD